jgi:hypothetical protein
MNYFNHPSIQSFLFIVFLSLQSSVFAQERKKAVEIQVTPHNFYLNKESLSWDPFSGEYGASFISSREYKLNYTHQVFSRIYFGLGFSFYQYKTNSFQMESFPDFTVGALRSRYVNTKVNALDCNFNFRFQFIKQDRWSMYYVLGGSFVKRYKYKDEITQHYYAADSTVSYAANKVAAGNDYRIFSGLRIEAGITKNLFFSCEGIMSYGNVQIESFDKPKGGVKVRLWEISFPVGLVYKF